MTEKACESLPVGDQKLKDGKFGRADRIGFQNYKFRKARQVSERVAGFGKRNFWHF